jgi:hypothetical protein
MPGLSTLPRSPLGSLALMGVAIVLGGCAVIMAASGQPEPDLAVCAVGATAAQIEAELGKPTSTRDLPGGRTECSYAFWKGDPPSYRRAAGHAVADVLTYGLWEIVYGTRMEADDQARRYEMRVTYGPDGRARDFVVERLADEDVDVLTGQIIEGTPLVDRIEARIGVYYPPELRDAQFKDRRLKSSGSEETVEYRLKLGPSAVQLFDTALAAQFSEVERIEDWPPPARRPDVSAVLEPQLEQASLDRVTFRVTLYRPDGAAYGDWTVTGKAMGSSPPFDADEAASRLEFALRDAAALLLTEFRDQAPVQQWLAEIGAPV